MRGPGLEARLDEVEWIADYDAYGAGDVAGPEVGGHGRNGLEYLGRLMNWWRGSLAMLECGARL